MNKQLQDIFDTLTIEVNNKNITLNQLYYCIFIIIKVIDYLGFDRYPMINLRPDIIGNKIILNYTTDSMTSSVIEIWNPVSDSGIFVHITTKRIVALFEHVSDYSLKVFVNYL